jgi:hypothetical protein
MGRRRATDEENRKAYKLSFENSLEKKKTCRR